MGYHGQRIEQIGRMEKSESKSSDFQMEYLLSLLEIFYILPPTLSFGEVLELRNKSYVGSDYFIADPIEILRIF